jgi:hypothetical protein
MREDPKHRAEEAGLPVDEWDLRRLDTDDLDHAEWIGLTAEPSDDISRRRRTA